MSLIAKPPVIELIVSIVQYSLWQLANGDYSFIPPDIKRRLSPDDASPRDGLILVEQDQQEEIVGYTDGNVCLVEKTQIVNVGVFCVPEHYADAEFGDPPAVDPMINQRASDVIRVLMADNQFGGQALDTTTCLGVQPLIVGDSLLPGFIVPLEVHYRHKEDDPTFNGAS